MNFLFYLFSSLAIVSGLGVVLSREGIQSALMMLLSLVSVASLFILLQAYLLAVLQIWIYAGAIMVLFVLMLMLWGKDALGGRQWVGRKALTGGMVLVLTTLVGVGIAVQTLARRPEKLPLPQEGFNPDAFTNQAKPLAQLLFSKYLLPLELVGLLLLGGLVAVLVLLDPRRSHKTALPQDSPQAHE